MKRSNPTLAQEDIQLFREVVGKVRPMPPKEPPPHAAPPHPEPKQTQLDERAVIAELLDGGDLPTSDAGEGLWFARPGVPERTLRQLRRGHFAVRAELDLHGFTVATAKEAVDSFMATCHNRSHYCVRIIHGKGLRSKANGPVLKRKLALWLQRRADVLAYCSARPTDGGSGAVYVLLRR